MIGELRDKESSSLFRDIAESGHRAFSSVHAPSAIDMITLRLVSSEMGIPRDVIATPNFINLLVYQALVPKLCPCCRRDATAVYDNAYLERIERLFEIDRSRMKAQNDSGCNECIRKGLPELNGSKGRIVVAEMIEPTPKMLLLFRESKNLELKSYIRNLRTAKFDEPDSTGKSALEVAMYHVAQGTIDPREVEVKFGSFEQYEAERQEEVLNKASENIDRG
jgi:type II secretory ATPase GspE/PulE/Tfp pilus assembly ATPase PilB-like protein